MQTRFKTAVLFAFLSVAWLCLSSAPRAVAADIPITLDDVVYLQFVDGSSDPIWPYAARQDGYGGIAYFPAIQIDLSPNCLNSTQILSQGQDRYQIICDLDGDPSREIVLATSQSVFTSDGEDGYSPPNRMVLFRYSNRVSLKKTARNRYTLEVR